METAIATQNPRLKVLAPVRELELKNPEDKLKFARKRGIPVEEPIVERVKVGSQSVGRELYVSDLATPGRSPAGSIRADQGAGTGAQRAGHAGRRFEAGCRRALTARRWTCCSLCASSIAWEASMAIGRSDVVEDRLFGIKSREFYEAPTRRSCGRHIATCRPGAEPGDDSAGASFWPALRGTGCTWGTGSTICATPCKGSSPRRRSTSPARFG